MSDAMNWLDAFACPPAEYRPVPFWSWNERMEPDEVRRQVGLMHEAGWGGAFVHSRIGLTTSYLGDAWFAAVDAVVDECRKLGMKVWLYDEDKWPSGFSGGSVPLADERFRSHCLIARPAGQQPPDGSTPIGPQASGLQVYQFIEPMGSDWFNGAGYANTLNRQAMARFLMDAYEVYHQRYGEDYGKTVLAQFTDEPAPLSHHSRMPDGHLPFTPEVVERFTAMHGYDPVGHLHLLFADAPEAPGFRLHYYQVINELFESHFSKQIGQWCTEHGLDLTGHFMNEHGMYEQQRVGFSIMPNYRHQGIPGIDHLGRQVIERVTAKQCQSVVNQQGKRRMLSELYGMAGQGMSFADRWWIGCQQIALGVNLLNPHLSLYTVAGCRKRDYPPNLFYQQPWWEVNHAVDEPLSRLCVAMSQGQYVAQTLVIHPQHSAQALWQGQSEPEDSRVVRDIIQLQTSVEVRQQIDALDAHFKAVVNELLGAQLGFDLGDETILSQDSRLELDGPLPVLRVGKMSYETVLLPAMVTMHRATLALLQAFEQAGGKVLRCGQSPKWLDGQPSDSLDAWLARVPSVSLHELAQALRENVRPVLELHGMEPGAQRDVLAQVRDLEDGSRLVMLTQVNRHRDVKDAACLIHGPWRSAQLLDPMDGTLKPVDALRVHQGLQVTLDLAPAQTRLMKLSSQEGQSSAMRLTRPSLRREMLLDSNDCRVERLDDNAMPLDTACWKEGHGEWSAHAIPVLSIQERLDAMAFDGPLSLRYHVEMTQAASSLAMRLIVEQAHRYEIKVNGSKVAHDGQSWWRDPRWHAMDVTGLLKPGQNIIELHCEAFTHGDRTILENPFARYGTEIEAIYLVGAFDVTAQCEAVTSPRPALWQRWGLPNDIPVWQAMVSTLTIDRPGLLKVGETVTQGLPFYAGRVRVTWPMPAVECGDHEHVMLELERLDAAAAKVEVDGREVGHLMTRPLTIDVTDAIRGGSGELSITLYGTLRNLLGPHHHQEGESPAVSPYSFSAYGGRSDVKAAADALRWAEQGKAPSHWRDDYCVIGFGEVGRARLTIAMQDA